MGGWRSPCEPVDCDVRGKDTADLVQSWRISWVNQSNPLVQITMNTMVATGASFTATYTFPTNSIQHTYRRTA